MSRPKSWVILAVLIAANAGAYFHGLAGAVVFPIGAVYGLIILNLTTGAKLSIEPDRQSRLTNNSEAEDV